MKNISGASLELKREKSETKKGKLCTQTGKSVPERNARSLVRLKQKIIPGKIILELEIRLVSQSGAFDRIA
jgi:hypothetical protein